MNQDGIPRYNILYLLLVPVIVFPMLAITILVIRGDKAGQLYNQALTAAAVGDYSAARRAFDEASDLGHAESAYDLAMLYRSGLIEAPNAVELERTYFQRAANNGSTAAEYELGVIAENSPETDYDLASLHYRKAALGGNIDGLLAMGRLHREGLGVNKSAVLAWEFYEKASNLGCHEAEVEMALLLISGDLGRIDYVAAESYLTRAAQARYPKAFTALGHLTEQSQPDLPEAQEKAGNYYRQAAELGDPEGLVNYGDYLTRRGRSGDAVKIYRQAADDLDFPPAQHRLGMYFYKLPQPDYSRSREYFRMSAASGNAASWINLGIMAELGQGCEPDVKSAIECYEMAEKLGHPDAPERLQSVRQNTETAGKQQ